MKSGLAVMLRLIADAESLPCELVCVFYDREEGPVHLGGMVPLCEAEGDFLRTLDSRGGLEPTSNRIEAGCSGSLQAQVFAQRKTRALRPSVARGKRDLSGDATTPKAGRLAKTRCRQA